MPEPIRPDEDIDAQYYTDDEDAGLPYHPSDTCKIWIPVERRSDPPAPPPRRDPGAPPF